MKPTNMLTLYVDEPSSKPVLVLGNSLGAGIGMWSAQLPMWQEKFRVIRFDYPGHNGTACGPEVVPDAKVWAQDLLAQLTKQGVDKFLYVGVSLGGMIGLQLAALEPSRVQRMVFSNARYFQVEAGREQWVGRIKQALEGREEAMEVIASETVKRWLSDEFRTQDPATAESLQRTLAETVPEGYAAGATVVRDYDARAFLDQVQCPVLLVAGSDDVAAPAEHVKELTLLLSSGRFEVITDSAHLSNVDSADRFIRIVDEFLLP